MSLWLVGKKRSITLMAVQSTNGTAMNMTTRIAISRLAILFIFPPAPIYLPHLNSKSFAAKRASAAREATIRHRHKKKPRTMPGLELPEKLDQHLATTGQPSRKRSLFQRGRCDRAQRSWPGMVPRQGCPNGCTGEGAGVGTNCLQPAGLRTGAQGMPDRRERTDLPFAALEEKPRTRRLG